jgi:hypothetical protein
MLLALRAASKTVELEHAGAVCLFMDGDAQLLYSVINK